MAVTEDQEQGTFIRPDGKEKVTGSGRYTADLNVTGQVHAKFRYADHPHARITRIDTTRARALPGVLAVLTHADVPDVRYGGMVQDRRLFAKEAVRWEGDIVAGVAALTPAIAAEAAALIEARSRPRSARRPPRRSRRWWRRRPRPRRPRTARRSFANIQPVLHHAAVAIRNVRVREHGEDALDCSWP